jgi:hypothetical protein
LPAGLNLNPSTGVISGTPSVATPTASYTVTATNSGGSTNAVLSITVNDATPTSLAYLINPAIYIQGTAIPANNPTSSGGAVVSYSVLPALPAGLTLNPVTGIISGTPTAVTPASNYSVTATNTGDSTSTLLSITVVSTASSVFKISVSSVPGQPSHRAIVFSPIMSGRTYTVKSSESLSPPNWIPLSGSTSSDNGNERTVIDTEATEAKKFYMIEISTP